MTIWIILELDNMEGSPDSQEEAQSSLAYAARRRRIPNSDACPNFWRCKLVCNRPIARINLSKKSNWNPG